MTRGDFIAQVEEHFAAHVILIDEALRFGTVAGDGVVGKVAQAVGGERSAKARAESLEIFQIVNFDVSGQSRHRHQCRRQGGGCVGLSQDVFECVFSEWH
ncbi:hypothetical protein D3C76_1722980 [compost metagenome]